MVLILLLAAGPTMAMHKGQWKPHRSNTGLAWFESDRGRFGFSHSGVLKVQANDGPEREVALASVVSVRFSYRRLESREALDEMGVVIWSRRNWPYQLDRYDVSLVTVHGDIPVFVAGQVFWLPPLIGGLVSRVVEMLDRGGFVPDVDGHARAVVNELQQEFAQRGHPLRLA